MKNRPMNTQGFTLVEVLVAMAIFSVLMLTLFSSFNAFTASGQRIKEQEQRRREKGMGLQTMVDDLEQIFILQPPRFKNTEDSGNEMDKKFEFFGTRTQEGGKSFSRLSFSSLTPVRFPAPDTGDPGIARLTYYVQDHGGRLDLHRSDRPILFYKDETEQAPCSDPVLFMDIQGFDLVFMDAEGQETDLWDSLDENHQFSLPEQVKILVILNRDGKTIRIETMVPILVRRTVDK